MRRAISRFLLGSLGLPVLQVTAVLVFLGLLSQTGEPLTKQDLEDLEPFDDGIG